MKARRRFQRRAGIGERTARGSARRASQSAARGTWGERACSSASTTWSKDETRQRSGRAARQRADDRGEPGVIGPARLQFDVQPGPRRQRVEDGLEALERHAATVGEDDRRGSDVGEVDVADEYRPGRAVGLRVEVEVFAVVVELRVMQDDRVPVAGQLYVEFDAVGNELDG